MFFNEMTPDELTRIKERFAQVQKAIRHGESRECQAMLAWFEFGHLPPHLAAVSARFAEMAAESVIAFQMRKDTSIPGYIIVHPNEQLLLGLQFLLQAKDAMVRAAIAHRGPEV